MELWMVMLLCIVTHICKSTKEWDFNLPDSHIGQMFYRHKHLRIKCNNDNNCPHKVITMNSVSVIDLKKT